LIDEEEQLQSKNVIIARRDVKFQSEDVQISVRQVQ